MTLTLSFGAHGSDDALPAFDDKCCNCDDG